MTTVSYAQNYEDVMLLRALADIERGFYIDVGAQDPVNDSVTKAFYVRGWRGINVEPVTHWYKKLVADRPHDINLQLAVSDQPGRLHLYEVVNSGLSTTDVEFAKRHAEAGYDLAESDIECVTLDVICATHAVTTVHFLKIDCEGAETAALRGISLENVRPWIILLEATEPNSQKPAYAEWEPLLLRRGYTFAYADGLNRFYVADEHAALLAAFSAPPNVFDRFVRAEQMSAIERVHSVESDLAIAMGARQHAKLEAETQKRKEDLERAQADLERAQLERAHFDAERRRFDAQFNAFERSAAVTDAAINESRRIIETMHAEVYIRERELERLRSDIRTLLSSKSWRVMAPFRVARRNVFKIHRTFRRLIYLAIRTVARSTKPVLRSAARSSILRGLVTSIAGKDSRITKTARLFLFGAPPPQIVPIAPEASLTDSAIKVLSIIDVVRQQKTVVQEPLTRDRD